MIEYTLLTPWGNLSWTPVWTHVAAHKVKKKKSVDTYYHETFLWSVAVIEILV